MVRLMIRILLVLFVLITAGCNLPTTQANPQENLNNPIQGSNPEFSGPQVMIQDPPSGYFTNPNTLILVHSIASDEHGISRVDLLENGILVRSDGTPDGVPQRQYSLLQAWIPQQIGDYVLAVMAYCSDGTPSKQAAIIVHVVEAEGIPETGAEQPLDCIATALTTLNIRQGPGVVYKIDGSLLMGQKARVTGKNGNGHWWQIDFNGAVGWISALHTLTEGTCDEIAEAAAPPPPADAAPIYRTPVPVAQAGETQPNEAETTIEWTIWEVIVDVWVHFFSPGPGDDPGYPPPETTPAEGYPPPETVPPTGTASTTSPQGYPPPSTNAPDGYPPPDTDTPAGYPMPETTASPGYPYPPPESTEGPTSLSRTIAPTHTVTVVTPTLRPSRSPQTPTATSPPTQPPTATPTVEPTVEPKTVEPTTAPTVEPTAVIDTPTQFSSTVDPDDNDDDDDDGDD